MRAFSHSLFAALLLLTGLAAAAPTVNLSAPANNAKYLAPATFNVSASVTPEAGTTIAKIEFYANDVLIGTDTRAGYSVPWTSIFIHTESGDRRLQTRSRERLTVSQRGPAQINWFFGISQK